MKALATFPWESGYNPRPYQPVPALSSSSQALKPPMCMFSRRSSHLHLIYSNGGTIALLEMQNRQRNDWTRSRQTHTHTHKDGLQPGPSNGAPPPLQQNIWSNARQWTTGPIRRLLLWMILLYFDCILETKLRIFWIHLKFQPLVEVVSLFLQGLWIFATLWYLYIDIY